MLVLLAYSSNPNEIKVGGSYNPKLKGFFNPNEKVRVKALPRVQFISSSCLISTILL